MSAALWHILLNQFNFKRTKMCFFSHKSSISSKWYKTHWYWALWMKTSWWKCFCVCVCVWSHFILLLKQICRLSLYQRPFLVTLQTQINILWMCWSGCFLVYILQVYFQSLFILGDVLLSTLALFQLSSPVVFTLLHPTRFLYIFIYLLFDALLTCKPCLSFSLTDFLFGFLFIHNGQSCICVVEQSFSYFHDCYSECETVWLWPAWRNNVILKVKGEAVTCIWRLYVQKLAQFVLSSFKSPQTVLNL